MTCCLRQVSLKYTATCTANIRTMPVRSLRIRVAIWHSTVGSGRPPDIRCLVHALLLNSCGHSPDSGRTGKRHESQVNTWEKCPNVSAQADWLTHRAQWQARPASASSSRRRSALPEEAGDAAAANPADARTACAAGAAVPLPRPPPRPSKPAAPAVSEEAVAALKAVQVSAAPGLSHTRVDLHGTSVRAEQLRASHQRGGAHRTHGRTGEHFALAIKQLRHGGS